MKLKSYIIMLAAAAGTGLFSACEDMLEPTSEYVLYDDGSHLTTPADTANSLVGLFYKLQAIGDRTNLLGEIRGDLVNLRSNASTDLKDLYNFNVGDDNKYNNPRDYYAIINNCNYYVTQADMEAFDNRGDRIFEKEMAQVKAIRAWTYLQLALNYGSVPFYDQALLTEQDANAIDLTASRRDIVGICDYFINDLQPYSQTEWPKLHGVGSVVLANCYFPVDMVLGDLYLWRASLTGSVADYRSAARCYYRWILDERLVDRIGNSSYMKSIYYPNRYSVEWGSDGAVLSSLSDSYSGLFLMSTNGYGVYNEPFTIIAMDSAASQGYYSELPRLYNTQTALNDDGGIYFDTSDGEYCITPSTYLQEISMAQSYYLLTSDGIPVEIEWDEDADPLVTGDLRLWRLWSSGSYNTTIGGEPATGTFSRLTKNNQRAIWIYRQTDTWLRLAEALNGAGLPRMAYAILATGISRGVVEDSIKPYCTDADWAFVEELNSMGTGNSFAKFNSRNGVRSVPDMNTIGIHSRGSGYAELNPDYAYPMVDSIAADGVTPINGYTGQDTLEWAQLHLEEEKLRVDSMLLTEMALETCFEGKRFYDLMRFAKRHHDNAWLADPVSKRKGAENQDQGLRNLLMTEDNWYLNWRGQIGR